MNEITKIFIGTIIGSFVLAVVIFAGYQHSLKSEGRISFPAGDTYLGPTPTQTNQKQAFTASKDTPWVSYSGNLYPYTFSYPETLSLVSFTNDSVGIDWTGVPPEQNVLVNIELIETQDPNLVGKPLEYVQDWWQYFSGLKGVRSVTEFTNSQGLKGYKAIYINQAGESPNVDVFFETPNEPSILIHLANGILDPEIFERIIDSVKFGQ